MTFGAQFFNQFNEDVTRKGVTMAVKHIGNSLRETPDRRAVIGANIITGSYFNADYPYFMKGPLATDYDKQMGMWRWAAHSTTLVPWSRLFQDRNDLLCNTYSDNRSDMVFWEMPPGGIVHALDFWIEPPDVALPPRKISAIVPADDTYVGLPRYVIAAVDATPDLTQNYGMMIFDEAGGVVYDSRLNNIVVRDFHVFSPADLEDILVNDAVRTFTPRVPPVGAPLISLSTSVSGRKKSNSGLTWFPNLTWDGTSFTLSRLTVNRSVWGNSTSLFFSIYQGFTLTVADAEW